MLDRWAVPDRARTPPFCPYCGRLLDGLVAGTCGSDGCGAPFARGRVNASVWPLRNEIRTRIGQTLRKAPHPRFSQRPQSLVVNAPFDAKNSGLLGSGVCIKQRGARGGGHLDEYWRLTLVDEEDLEIFLSFHGPGGVEGGMGRAVVGRNGALYIVTRVVTEWRRLGTSVLDVRERLSVEFDFVMTNPVSGLVRIDTAVASPERVWDDYAKALSYEGENAAERARTLIIDHARVYPRRLNRSGFRIEGVFGTEEQDDVAVGTLVRGSQGVVPPESAALDLATNRLDAAVRAERDEDIPLDRLFGDVLSDAAAAAAAAAAADDRRLEAAVQDGEGVVWVTDRGEHAWAPADPSDFIESQREDDEAWRTLLDTDPAATGSPLMVEGWIECRHCFKWRRVPAEVAARVDPGTLWTCSRSRDLHFNTCRSAQQFPNEVIDARVKEGSLAVGELLDGIEAAQAKLVRRRNRDKERRDAAKEAARSAAARAEAQNARRREAYRVKKAQEASGGGRKGGRTPGAKKVGTSSSSASAASIRRSADGGCAKCRYATWGCRRCKGAEFIPLAMRSKR